MSPVSILLADDDAVIRQCIRRALKSEPDVEVRWEADNGLQALLLSKQYQPQIVLMDANMPRMDGIEALRCLRQCNRAVKVLVMSVYEETRAQAMAAGADAFVTKDCGCTGLRAAIAGLVKDLLLHQDEDRRPAA